jgi:hypothetical protein
LGFGFNGNDEDGLKEMTLKEEWDRLDSETRQWLLDNPGCVLVPNTITARIQDTSARQIEVDEHGQMILSSLVKISISSARRVLAWAQPTSVTTCGSSMQPSPGKANRDL